VARGQSAQHGDSQSPGGGGDVPREVKIVLLFRFLEMIPKQKKSSLKSLTRLDSIRWTLDPLRNRGDNNLDLLLTARTRRGGASVVAKKSRPFFTCHQTREGIKGVFGRGGCGLPSPSRSPPIGERRVLTVNCGINRQLVFMKWRKAPGVFPGDTVRPTHPSPVGKLFQTSFPSRIRLRMRSRQTSWFSPTT